MPSPQDAAPPSESIQSLPPAAASMMRLPKMRQTSGGHASSSSSSAAAASDLPLRNRPLPLSQSDVSLPLRRGTPTTTAASLYASTLSPPGSRSMSPIGFGRSSSPPQQPLPPSTTARTMSLTSNASTSTAPGTPAGPGNPRGGPAAAGSSSSSSSLPHGSAFTRSLLDSPAVDNPGDPLSLILKAFVPHVAVCSSQDTDDLVREKGFANGLWDLLRPFGEHVPGRVHVRDSNGAPRPWDDFSVRFVNFGDNIEAPEPAQGIIQPPVSAPARLVNGRPGTAGGAAAGANTGAGSGAGSGAAAGGAGADDAAQSNATSVRIPLVEAVVEKHLTYAESAFSGLPTSLSQQQQQGDASGLLDVGSTSPYYSLYLRRMLSGLPIACHETFAHPVACVIAISSRNASPIQTFQDLYREISQGERRLPPWVDGDFLRYYVLVHDEEQGDIAQSMALFEKMKRSLGLHCHLLRLRSTACAETDDDSLLLPRNDWMTAAEEYADLSRSEAYEEAADDDKEPEPYDPARYIFESDATAIRTFVRELVTQSLLPTMERSVSVWNDQVASKRKGLSGRFMSLSKRWGGLGVSVGGGGGSSGSGGSGGNRNSAGGNSDYNAVHGYYNAESHEAILRKLADYAFMLRDWKLAMSTYDLLRADYTTDKAWKYHAAANEMCALSLLIMQPSLSSRTKPESINGMLEQGFYSYHTRCGNAYGAFRVVALGLELQRLRGGSAVDEAVRWGMRLLEARLVGTVGDALLHERMAVCCATRAGRGGGGVSGGSTTASLSLGSWRRKSAFWSVLAAQAWVAQGKFIQAQRCLNEARNMYSMLPSDDGVDGFAAARDCMRGLQAQIKQGLAAAAAWAAAGQATGRGGDEEDDGDGQSEEDDEEDDNDDDDDDDDDEARDSPAIELLVDDSAKDARRRRSSMMGGGGAGSAGLETAPLRSAVDSRGESHGPESAGFDEV